MEGAGKASDWRELGGPWIKGIVGGLGGSWRASGKAVRAPGKAGRASGKAERASGKAGRADADADAGSFQNGKKGKVLNGLKGL